MVYTEEKDFFLLMNSSISKQKGQRIEVLPNNIAHERKLSGRAFRVRLTHEM